jgi:hypothetical protein
MVPLHGPGLWAIQLFGLCPLARLVPSSLDPGPRRGLVCGARGKCAHDEQSLRLGHVAQYRLSGGQLYPLDDDHDSLSGHYCGEKRPRGSPEAFL